MRPDNAQGGAIRVTSAGHVLFAASLLWLGWLGATGLGAGKFAQIWQPVPKWVPAREVLAYFCTFVSLVSGFGLLWRRTAAIASRAIFSSLLVWLLVMRVPNLFYEKPLVLVAWTFGATSVMLAGAWLLYVRLAGDGDARSGFFTGAVGVRIARVLFGLALVPFGLAHFMYLDATTVLIPNWLPLHVAWAYFTGAAFIAGGLVVAVGVIPRLAAALVTLQMGLFSVIVWMPRVFSGKLTDFQRGEVVSTWVLMAGAWVVAESYRRSSEPVRNRQ